MGLEKADWLFITVIIVLFVLYEIFFGEYAVGGEFRYTPPPPDDVVIDVGVRINGESVEMRLEQCPDPQPRDPSKCPTGYKCTLDHSKGQMTKRIDIMEAYKTEQRAWAKRQREKK